MLSHTVEAWWCHKDLIGFCLNAAKYMQSISFEATSVLVPVSV